MPENKQAHISIVVDGLEKAISDGNKLGFTLQEAVSRFSGMTNLSNQLNGSLQQSVFLSQRFSDTISDVSKNGSVFVDSNNVQQAQVALDNAKRINKERAALQSFYSSLSFDSLSGLSTQMAKQLDKAIPKILSTVIGEMSSGSISKKTFQGIVTEASWSKSVRKALPSSFKGMKDQQLARYLQPIIGTGISASKFDSYRRDVYGMDATQTHLSTPKHALPKRFAQAYQKQGYFIDPNADKTLPASRETMKAYRHLFKTNPLAAQAALNSGVGTYNRKGQFTLPQIMSSGDIEKINSALYDTFIGRLSGRTKRINPYGIGQDGQISADALSTLARRTESGPIRLAINAMKQIERISSAEDAFDATRKIKNARSVLDAQRVIPAQFAIQQFKPFLRNASPNGLGKGSKVSLMQSVGSRILGLDGRRANESVDQIKTINVAGFDIKNKQHAALMQKILDQNGYKIGDEHYVAQGIHGTGDDTVVRMIRKKAMDQAIQRQQRFFKDRGYELDGNVFQNFVGNKTIAGDVGKFGKLMDAVNKQFTPGADSHIDFKGKNIGVVDLLGKDGYQVANGIGWLSDLLMPTGMQTRMGLAGKGMLSSVNLKKFAENAGLLNDKGQFLLPGVGGEMFDVLKTDGIVDKSMIKNLDAFVQNGKELKGEQFNKLFTLFTQRYGAQAVDWNDHSDREATGIGRQMMQYMKLTPQLQSWQNAQFSKRLAAVRTDQGIRKYVLTDPQKDELAKQYHETNGAMINSPQVQQRVNNYIAGLVGRMRNNELISWGQDDENIGKVKNERAIRTPMQALALYSQSNGTDHLDKMKKRVGNILRQNFKDQSFSDDFIESLITLQRKKENGQIENLVADFQNISEEEVGLARSPTGYGQYGKRKNVAKYLKPVYDAFGFSTTEGIAVSKDDAQLFGSMDFDGDKLKVVTKQIMRMFDQAQKAVIKTEAVTDINTKAAQAAEGGVANDVANKMLYIDRSLKATQAMGSSSGIGQRAIQFDLSQAGNRSYLNAAWKSNEAYDKATTQVKRAIELEYGKDSQIWKALGLGAQYGKFANLIPQMFWDKSQLKDLREDEEYSDSLFRMKSQQNAESKMAQRATIQRDFDLFIPDGGDDSRAIKIQSLRDANVDKMNLPSVYIQPVMQSINALVKARNASPQLAAQMDKDSSVFMQALDQIGFQEGIGQSGKAMLQTLRNWRKEFAFGERNMITKDEEYNFDNLLSQAKQEIEKNIASHYVSQNDFSVVDVNGKRMKTSDYRSELQRLYHINVGENVSKFAPTQANMRRVYGDDVVDNLPENSDSVADMIKSKRNIEHERRVAEALEEANTEPERRRQEIEQILDQTIQQTQGPVRSIKDIEKQQKQIRSKYLKEHGLTGSDWRIAQNQLLASDSEQGQTYRANMQLIKSLKGNNGVGSEQKIGAGVQATDLLAALTEVIGSTRQDVRNSNPMQALQYLAQKLPKQYEEQNGKRMWTQDFLHTIGRLGSGYRKVNDRDQQKTFAQKWYGYNEGQLNRLHRVYEENRDMITPGMQKLVTSQIGFLDENFKTARNIRARQRIDKTNESFENFANGKDKDPQRRRQEMFDKYEDYIKQIQSQKQSFEKSIKQRPSADPREDLAMLSDFNNTIYKARENYKKGKQRVWQEDETQITDQLKSIKSTILPDPFERIRDGANKTIKKIQQLRQKYVDLQKEQGKSQQQAEKSAKNAGFDDAIKNAQDKKLTDIRRAARQTILQDNQFEHQVQSAILNGSIAGTSSVARVSQGINNQKINNQALIERMTQWNDSHSDLKYASIREDNLRRINGLRNIDYNKLEKYQLDNLMSQSDLQAQQVANQAASVNRNINYQNLQRRLQFGGLANTSVGRAYLSTVSQRNNWQTQVDSLTTRKNDIGEKHRIALAQLASMRQDNKNGNKKWSDQQIAAQQAVVADLSKQYAALGQNVLNAQGMLANFSGTAGIANTVMTAIGNTLSMVITRSLRLAMQEAKRFVKEYDSIMTQIQMITTGSTNKNQLGAKLINKSIGLKASFSDVGKATAALYRQGLSDEEVDARTDSVIKLSKIAGMKAQDATKLITVSLNSGLATSAQQVTDVISAIGDSAATTAAEISKGFQKAAASAAQVGVEYNDLVSMLAVITSKTQLGGNTAGTMLNTLFGRWTNTTSSKLGVDADGNVYSANDISKALGYAGISMTKKGGGLRDITDVLEELGEVWNDLQDWQKNMITTSMAGTRQMSNFSALMAGFAERDENGQTMIAKERRLAKEAGGTTDKKYDEYLKSFGASTTTFRSSFDAFVQSFSGVLPILSGIIDTFSGFFKALASFNNIGNGAVGTIVASIITILAAVAGVAAAVTSGNAGLLMGAAKLLGVSAGIGMGTNIVTGLSNKKTTENYAYQQSKANAAESYRQSLISRAEELASNGELGAGTNDSLQLQSLFRSFSDLGMMVGITTTDFKSLSENAQQAARALGFIKQEQKEIRRGSDYAKISAFSTDISSDENKEGYSLKVQNAKQSSDFKAFLDWDKTYLESNPASIKADPANSKMLDMWAADGNTIEYMDEMASKYFDSGRDGLMSYADRAMRAGEALGIQFPYASLYEFMEDIAFGTGTNSYAQSYLDQVRTGIKTLTGNQFGYGQYNRSNISQLVGGLSDMQNAPTWAPNAIIDAIVQDMSNAYDQNKDNVDENYLTNWFSKHGFISEGKFTYSDEAMKSVVGAEKFSQFESLQSQRQGKVINGQIQSAIQDGRGEYFNAGQLIAEKAIGLNGKYDAKSLYDILAILSDGGSIAGLVKQNPNLGHVYNAIFDDVGNQKENTDDFIELLYTQMLKAGGYDAKASRETQAKYAKYLLENGYNPLDTYASNLMSDIFGNTDILDVWKGNAQKLDKFSSEEQYNQAVANAISSYELIGAPTRYRSASTSLFNNLTTSPVSALQTIIAQADKNRKYNVADQQIEKLKTGGLFDYNKLSVYASQEQIDRQIAENGREGAAEYLRLASQTYRENQNSIYQTLLKNAIPDLQSLVKTKDYSTEDLSAILKVGNKQNPLSSLVEALGISYSGGKLSTSSQTGQLSNALKQKLTNSLYISDADTYSGIASAFSTKHGRSAIPLLSDEQMALYEKDAQLQRYERMAQKGIITDKQLSDITSQYSTNAALGITGTNDQRFGYLARSITGNFEATFEQMMKALVTGSDNGFARKYIKDNKNNYDFMAQMNAIFSQYEKGQQMLQAIINGQEIDTDWAEQFWDQVQAAIVQGAANTDYQKIVASIKNGLSSSDIATQMQTVASVVTQDQQYRTAKSQYENYAATGKGNLSQLSSLLGIDDGLIKQMMKSDSGKKAIKSLLDKKNKQIQQAAIKGLTQSLSAKGVDFSSLKKMDTKRLMEELKDICDQGQKALLEYFNVHTDDLGNMSGEVPTANKFNSSQQASESVQQRNRSNAQRNYIQLEMEYQQSPQNFVQKYLPQSDVGLNPVDTVFEAQNPGYTSDVMSGDYATMRSLLDQGIISEEQYSAARNSMYYGKTDGTSLDYYSSMGDLFGIGGFRQGDGGQTAGPADWYNNAGIVNWNEFGQQQAQNILGDESLKGLFEDTIGQIDGMNEALVQLARNGQLTSDTMSRVSHAVAEMGFKQMYGDTQRASRALDGFDKGLKALSGDTKALRDLDTQIKTIDQNLDDAKESLDRAKSGKAKNNDWQNLAKYLDNVDADQLKNNFSQYSDAIEQALNDQQANIEAAKMGFIDAISQPLDGVQVVVDGQVDVGAIISALQAAGVVIDDKMMQLLSSQQYQAYVLAHADASGRFTAGLSNITKTGGAGARGSGGGGGTGKKGGGGGSKPKEKSAAEILAEKMNAASAQFNHTSNLFSTIEKMYEDDGKFAMAIKVIEDQIALNEDYGRVLEQNISTMRGMVDALQAGTDDWKTLTSVLQKSEQEYYKLIADNKQLKRKMDELRKSIKQTRVDLEDSIETVIEEMIQANRDALDATVSLQNDILEAIKERYQDEWDLVKKDVEKKKQALQKEKDLISERLQARKDAEDEAKKYEELASLKQQLALVEADASRTKEAADLREKISNLEEEISWDIAQKQAEAQQQQLDDQINALEEYVQQGDEDLEDFLSDANNFTEEVNRVLSGSFETLSAWLSTNVKQFGMSLQAAQAQMLNGWEDTWKTMNHITDTYWSQINGIIGTADPNTLSDAQLGTLRKQYIEYMKANSRQYAIASNSAKQVMQIEWNELFDDWMKASDTSQASSYESLASQFMADYWNNMAKIFGGWSVNITNSSGGGGGSKGGGSTTQDASNRWVVYGSSQNVVQQGTASSKAQAQKDAQAYIDKQKYKSDLSYSVYATGGQSRQTGFAWLDGTPERPERILSPEQTESFDNLVGLIEDVDFSSIKETLDDFGRLSDYMSRINIDNPMKNFDLNTNDATNNVTVGDVNVTIEGAKFEDDADYEYIALRVGQAFTKQLSKQGLHFGNYKF